MFKKKRLTPEEFVTAWQLAESVDLFCENTGMKKGSATVRACFYRKKGINLKKFPRGKSSGRNCLDIEMLNQLIAASTEEVVITDDAGPAGSIWTESPFC